MLAGTLAGCGAAGDGRFTGDFATTQGNCGLGLDAQGRSSATLVVRDGVAEFAPSDGVVVLPGRMDAAGHVLAGSSVTGADKKPFPQVFDGHRDGDQVRGTFASPRCRASVELRRS